jgi:D-methionine transport system substrate-binding protein
MNQIKNHKWLKIILSLVTLVSISVILTGCGKSNTSGSKDEIVKVGVVGTADNPIWKQVNKNLAKDHIKVKLVSFTDGILANQEESNKDLDLTAFQHYAFLHQEEKTKHYKFSVIGQSYLVPLNVFSKKIKNLNQIKNGDKIAIPNNVTNAGRALKVLQSAGLIKLDPSKGDAPAIKDITQNKHHLKIVQVDPAKIISLLPDFAAGITNSNFVQAAHMNPIKDAIYQVTPKYNDPKNKPWINVIVARKGDENNATYKKVVKAYHTASVAKVMKAQFDGVYTPAFKY